jgi:fructose-1,6-bisphosphatase/inositol monophosphatase family enzyme
MNAEDVSTIIKECAERYILPRYKQLAAHEISTKTSPRDLVTQADIDVEDHLTRTLPGLLPGSIVIGEEAASKTPELLKQLQDKSLKIWIVDPVDGTHNFVHSKREFGVMLALVENGETTRSWIYDVLGKEMTVAEKGAGSFANGKKLAVKSKAEKKDMAGHVNSQFFPKQYRDDVKAAMEQFGDCVSLSCAAHEYLRVARGQAQFSIYSRLKPWDHLAGALIVGEAGGYTAMWSGEPYTPRDVDVGLITASDRHVWENVLSAFIKDKR